MWGKGKAEEFGAREFQLYCPAYKHSTLTRRTDNVLNKTLGYITLGTRPCPVQNIDRNLTQKRSNLGKELDVRRLKSTLLPQIRKVLERSSKTQLHLMGCSAYITTYAL